MEGSQAGTLGKILEAGAEAEAIEEDGLFGLLPISQLILFFLYNPSPLGWTLLHHFENASRTWREGQSVLGSSSSEAPSSQVPPGLHQVES